MYASLTGSPPHHPDCRPGSEETSTATAAITAKGSPPASSTGAELWTGVSPTGAYWNPTWVVLDNRLAAHASDTTTYSFAAPGDGEVEVRVQLLFRRAFIDLADQKGWDRGDIRMAEAIETIAVTDE